MAAPCSGAARTETQRTYGDTRHFTSLRVSFPRAQAKYTLRVPRLRAGRTRLGRAVPMESTFRCLGTASGVHLSCSFRSLRVEDRRRNRQKCRRVAEAMRRVSSLLLFSQLGVVPELYGKVDLKKEKKMSHLFFLRRYLARNAMRGRALSRMAAFDNAKFPVAFLLFARLNICSVSRMCHGRVREAFSSRARPVTSPIKRA